MIVRAEIQPARLHPAENHTFFVGRIGTPLPFSAEQVLGTTCENRAPPSTAQPSSYGALPPSDSPNGAVSSLPGLGRTKPAAEPTRFRALQRALHPLHQIAGHPRAGT